MSDTSSEPGKPRNRNTVILLLLFILLLTFDQTLKIWVKLHFQLGEQHPLFGWSWIRLHFVENEGNLFGFLIGGEKGRIISTSIRLLATVFIAWVLYRFIIEKKSFALQLSLVLILTGATGNLLDCIFYGVLFSASPFHGGYAEWLPHGGGYAPLFMGKVVDMWYLPIIDTHWPEWIPYLGGKELEVSKPVFNLSDLSIFFGISGLILFFKKW